MTTLSEELQEAARRQEQSQLGGQQHQVEAQSPARALVSSGACDPIGQAYALRREYIAAMLNPVSGMYPLPSGLSPFTWYGLLFVRSGPYQGYIVRFTMHISTGFPDSACPEVYISLPYVFHPHVDPANGHVDVARGFRTGWQPGGNRLWHALHYLRRLFLRPDESLADQQPQQQQQQHPPPLNPAAAALLLSDRPAFRARLAAELPGNQAAVGPPPLPGDPAADVIWRPVVTSETTDGEQPVVRRRVTCADAGGGGSGGGFSWMSRDSMRIMAGHWPSSG